MPRIAAGSGDGARFISASGLRHSEHVAGGEPNLSLLAQHAMLDALPEHADLDLFVDNHLGETLGNIVALNVPGADHRWVILGVVRWARKEGQIDRLVKALHDHHGHHASVRALVRQVFPGAPSTGAAAPAWTAHLPCCIDDATVVIGRERLQRAIEVVERRNGVNVVVVQGPPRSGKTFTYRVIDALAPVYNYRVAWLHLRDDVAAGSGPEAFVRALLYQMGLGAIALPERGGDPIERWTETLVDWVIGQLRPLRAGGAPWWIIVDGCDAPGASGLRVLLRRLAAKIHVVLRRDVRLCLLGYDEPLPDPLRGLQPEVLAPIGERELARFFRLAFEQHGEDIDDEAIAAAVDCVLARHRAIAGDRPDALGSLHDVVRDAVRALLDGRSA